MYDVNVLKGTPRKSLKSAFAPARFRGKRPRARARDTRAHRNLFALYHHQAVLLIALKLPGNILFVMRFAAESIIISLKCLPALTEGIIDTRDQIR